MAHTYDTKVQFLTGATDPRAFNYTCGAGSTLLVLLIVGAGTTYRTGADPTYNGVAFTLGDKNVNLETFCELWYMLAPPTGSALSVSIENDNTRTIFGCAASFKAGTGYGSALRTCSKVTGTTVNPGGPTMTGLAAGDVIVSVIGTGDNTFAPSAQTGTIIYTYDPAAYGMSSQYYITPDTADRSLTWTEATADDWQTVVASFREVVGPEEHSGAALIHGNGTMIPVAQKNGKGSAVASGNGSLAGIVQKAGLGSAITSGKGALVAIGIAAMMGLANLSGGGVQIAAGLKAAQNVASISGGGTLTATGTLAYPPEEHSGTAAVSGAGSLVASGAKAISISASISGAGSLIGGGLKAGEGLGTIHGNGSLAATGTAVEYHSGVATMSGGGTASGVGLKAGSGPAGPIFANGAQVAGGIKGGLSIAGISGNGSLIATGDVGGVEHHSGIAAISGSGSLSSAGIKDGRDSAVISGNGSIIATGEETKPENYFGVAFISGGCHLTASGTAWWYDQSKRTIKRRSPIGAGRSINPTRSIQLVRSLKRPEIRKKTTRRNYP